MKAYIIGRGEDLRGIAARLGFDPDEVWNADENRELRERRHSPQVLAPGDVIFVPEAEQEDLAVTAKTTNEYVADVEYLLVRVQLAAGGSRPRGGEPYEVHGLREVITGTADGDGVIEVEVPAHARQVFLHFPDQGTTTRVRLGDLNPEDDDDGIRTRLFNLGYLPNDEMMGPRLARRQTPDQRRQDLADAVRHFQEEAGLDATGELDDATRAAIRERHGA